MIPRIGYSSRPLILKLRCFLAPHLQPAGLQGCPMEQAFDLFWRHLPTFPVVAMGAGVYNPT